MIMFQDTLDGITAEHLRGFFVGWPDPPTPETHYQLLRHSQHIILAIDDQSQHVVGFVTALSDGILCAYIPLLEILPGYQDQGIGSELMRRMLARLHDLYMIDLLCDVELQPFYAKVGMRPATGMMFRNYARQSGASA
ncbi:MAG TPA: GNAT family N-acetyltransferase [Kouleothrix sp.]|uniref:GNAT family N-acetyltransferase n=1 Tax=Kouleothrix sp. TaxID=2779161 RepID=UPI002C3C1F12|nr:GNAT family N-acetyltransferase [Kouleothrix sp.]